LVAHKRIELLLID